MSRAKCVCNSPIRLGANRRFLFHYTGGPGIGIVCPGSGKTMYEAKKAQEARP